MLPDATGLVLPVDSSTGDWEPEFEIEHRLVVPAAAARRYVRYPDEGATRIHLRALVEAGLVGNLPGEARVQGAC